MSNFEIMQRVKPKQFKIMKLFFCWGLIRNFKYIKMVKFHKKMKKYFLLLNYVSYGACV